MAFRSTEKLAQPEQNRDTQISDLFKNLETAIESGDLKEVKQVLEILKSIECLGPVTRSDQEEENEKVFKLLFKYIQKALGQNKLLIVYALLEAYEIPSRTEFASYINEYSSNALYKRAYAEAGRRFNVDFIQGLLERKTDFFIKLQGQGIAIADVIHNQMALGDKSFVNQVEAIIKITALWMKYGLKFDLDSPLHAARIRSRKHLGRYIEIDFIEAADAYLKKQQLLDNVPINVTQITEGLLYGKYKYVSRGVFKDRARLITEVNAPWCSKINSVLQPFSFLTQACRRIKSEKDQGYDSKNEKTVIPRRS